MGEKVKKYLIITSVMTSFLLSGCYDSGITPTGKACLGENNDSLVEGLKGQCKKGDIVGTKHPAYFCDFKSAVAYNAYDSAMCIYTGQEAEERIKDESTAK